MSGEVEREVGREGSGGEGDQGGGSLSGSLPFREPEGGGERGGVGALSLESPSEGNVMGTSTISIGGGAGKEDVDAIGLVGTVVGVLHGNSDSLNLTFALTTMERLFGFHSLNAFDPDS